MKNTSLKVVIGAVLFLSLSANMALAGMVAGNHAATSAIEKIGNALAAFADLSGDSRDKAVGIFKAKWPDMQKQLGDIKQKREEVKQILAKPDYKRADAEKVMADLRKDVTQLQEEGQTMALDIADSITPQERVELMKKLEVKP
jgi:Spy/CpxP family protein refolding chaperone